MPPFEDMRDINLAKLRRLDEEVGVDLEDVAEMLTERDYRIAEMDARVRTMDPEEGRLAYALCLSSSHANILSEWPCAYHLGRAQAALKLLRRSPNSETEPEDER